MKAYKTQKEFLEDLQEVPKHWLERSFGEKYYIAWMDVYFKSKKEAKEYFASYKNEQ